MLQLFIIRNYSRGIIGFLCVNCILVVFWHRGLDPTRPTQDGKCCDPPRPDPWVDPPDPWVDPPTVSNPEISPPKVNKRTSGTQLYRHAKFHADRPEITVPGQNIYIFPYSRLPWGLPSQAIHFQKLPSSPNWHVTLRLIPFSIYSLLEAQNFGFCNPSGYHPQKSDKTRPGRMYHRAKFHDNPLHRRPDICPDKNKKLSCRREAARCFVFVCSQLQHTYSAVFITSYCGFRFISA